MDQIDWVLVVRGASAGFTILVISGLAHPLVVRMSETAGLVWLVAGAVLAFVVAAFRSGTADSPFLTGMFAALISYTLSIPLIYISSRQLIWTDVAMFAVLAVVVGGITGLLAGRRAS